MNFKGVSNGIWFIPGDQGGKSPTPRIFLLSLGSTMSAVVDNAMQQRRNNENDNASPGLIAGVVIAALIFVILCFAVAYYFCWKQRRPRELSSSQAGGTPSTKNEDDMMDYSLQADSSNSSSNHVIETYLRDRLAKKMQEKMSQESESIEPKYTSDDDFSYDQVGDAIDEEFKHSGKKPLSNSGNNQRKVATVATTLSASEAPFDEPTVDGDQKLNKIIDDIETDIANAIEVIENGSFDEDVDSGPEIIIEDPSTLLPSYPLSDRRKPNRSNLSTKRSSSSEADQQDDLSHFLRERRKEARRSRESRKQPPINMEI